MKHSNNLYISIGSIIIDDIIMPDGESKMNILGGGTSHTCMGMRLWSNQVGIISQVGTDFPGNHMKKMSDLFLTDGLVTRETETTRAWQLLEEDGTRNEIFRTDFEQMITTAPTPAEFPDKFKGVKGVHLHSALDMLPEWVKFLRSLENDPIILWEPWDPFCAPENLDRFMDYASLMDIVSPNYKEAANLTGIENPHNSASFLLESGVNHVVIRYGSRGSVIASNDGSLFAINAVPPESLEDTTGAGNAYCGGFICGLSEGNLEKGAEWGSVSASFALSQFGALYDYPGNLHHELENRLKTLSIKYYNPRRPIFDRMAKTWDKQPLPDDFEDKAHLISEAGNIQPGSVVLDIGTGTGNLNKGLLVNKPKNLISLDISHAMLKESLGKNKNAKNIDSVQGDAEHIPLANNIADVIICHGAFPHIPDANLALTEFSRVLKPGGKLVITHSIGREMVNFIHTNARSRTLHQDILPTAEDLSIQLQNNGWRILELRDADTLYLVSAEQI